MSAEPKTDPTKRAYMRVPDGELWFVDFHAYQARVHGKSLAYNIRRAKHLVLELFGPVAPDTFHRWRDGGASDLGGRPPVDLPPFAFRPFASREPHTCRRGQVQSQCPHLAARPPPGAARARHRIRAQQTMDAAVSSEPAVIMEACSDLHRPSEADIARERKLLQLRVIYLCDRFKISQDRIWNLDETAVRMVPTGERGWTKKSRVSPCRRLARLRHAHARCKHERRHVDSYCLSAPARVPLSDALDHAGHSPGHNRRD